MIDPLLLSFRRNRVAVKKRLGLRVGNTTPLLQDAGGKEDLRGRRWAGSETLGRFVAVAVACLVLCVGPSAEADEKALRAAERFAMTMLGEIGAVKVKCPENVDEVFGANNGTCAIYEGTSKALKIEWDAAFSRKFAESNIEPLGPWELDDGRLWRGYEIAYEVTFVVMHETGALVLMGWAPTELIDDPE